MSRRTGAETRRGGPGGGAPARPPAPPPKAWGFQQRRRAATEERRGTSSTSETITWGGAPGPRGCVWHLRREGGGEWSYGAIHLVGWHSERQRGRSRADGSRGKWGGGLSTRSPGPRRPALAKRARPRARPSRWRSSRSTCRAPGFWRQTHTRGRERLAREGFGKRGKGGGCSHHGLRCALGDHALAQPRRAALAITAARGPVAPIPAVEDDGVHLSRAAISWVVHGSFRWWSARAMKC